MFYWWGLALLLLMAIAAITSRALLSIFSVLFFLICFFHVNWKQFRQLFFNNPFMWGMASLFFVSAVSGIWSNDTDQWLRLMVIKLPYLLMPLAFVAIPAYKWEAWKKFTWLLIFFVLLACSWSVWQYWGARFDIEQRYLAAKILPVLMDNDHLRFSWLIVLVMIAAMYLFEHATLMRDKIASLGAVILLFIFLHVLAARTGLLLAYLFFFGYLMIHFRTGLKCYVQYIFLLIALTSIAAWFAFPTLQNRFSYLRYTYTKSSTEYVAGSVDGNRWLSLQAGWHVLSKHPWGVGLGDIRAELLNWYNLHHPGMAAEDQLTPANEWIIHGCIAGWPGVILFSIAIFAPFFYQSVRRSFYLVSLSFFAILIALTDSSLEGQFGIFIYTFSMLWWWLWEKSKKDNFVV